VTARSTPLSFLCAGSGAGPGGARLCARRCS
jgi:hypothetical protein